MTEIDNKSLKIWHELLNNWLEATDKIKNDLLQNEFISEIPYGTKAYIAYDLGAWAIAYLISIVDIETYRVDFYNSLNEHGWEESFIINFNMTSNEFLIDFHEFLNLSIEEQLSIIP